MKVKSFLFLLLMVTTSVFAACPQLYPNGKVLTPDNTIELCNSFYVSRYNDKDKAVILTSEVLKPTGHTIERSNNFRPDNRTSVSNRVSPIDYIRTGYDRGHMVPAGDSTTDAEMSSTFLMTNIVPQKPTLNRGAWNDLEQLVRRLVQFRGRDTWVVTGAIYDGLNFINGIPVPSGYYKIVYGSKQRVFYAPNVDNAKVTEITIIDLQDKIKNSWFKS